MILKFLIQFIPPIGYYILCGHQAYTCLTTIKQSKLSNASVYTLAAPETYLADLVLDGELVCNLSFKLT